MNITVDKKEDCTANINIEIPSEKVNSERSEIIKAFSSQANIRGFRKGKAPVRVIEKRYASDIKAELEQRLISEAVSEAIKQEDLKVLDVAVQQEPSYSDENLKVEALAILAPEITLPEYKGIEVELDSEEVTDEEITTSIDELRNRFSKYNDTETALEDDQFAIIDFTSNIDGKPVEEVIGKSAGFVGGREGHWVKIQDDAFMPGFSEGLKGMKKDEQKTITVTVQDEFPIKDLIGKSINFDVTVKETKVQELPELNDEFVGTFLPDQTVDDLKELLKTNLAEEKKKGIRDDKMEQILQNLHEG